MFEVDGEARYEDVGIIACFVPENVEEEEVFAVRRVEHRFSNEYHVFVKCFVRKLRNACMWIGCMWRVDWRLEKKSW